MSAHRQLNELMQSQVDEMSSSKTKSAKGAAPKTLTTVHELKDAEDVSSISSNISHTDKSEQSTDHIAQSPDISLSSQTTLRYADVISESNEHNSSGDGDGSSDSTEMFEDASAQHDEPQFKNSFYEKLSVTFQNLESTVASLQKSPKDEHETLNSCCSIDVKEESSSQLVTQDSNVVRPETLSLSQPVSVDDSNRKLSHISKKLQNVSVGSRNLTEQDGQSVTNDEDSLGAHYIEPSNPSPNLLQGILTRKGDMIEFVANNLEEKIKQSSPLMHTDSASSHESRRSSVRSIASASSSTSFATSSGVSRSPSSLIQTSPDDIPPIDVGAVLELENHAQRVADSLDLMMGNIKNNLHKMSAITIGCQDAYKRSVDITCDSVDSSIKTMYALMAKCEELSFSMGPVEQLAAQIREIKRILDLFELQVSEK